MDTLSPLPIVFVVVVVLLALGSIITVFRRFARFRNYEALTADARAIARSLRGEVFRDGDDLVISGNRGAWPLVVRFSHAETMPGLDIRMEAPASFTLWFAPRSAGAKEGRAMLRTGDAMFDGRFSVRSDHPTQATLLLSARRMVPVLVKLCRCANAHLSIAAGAIELTEEVIPAKNVAEYVQEHVAALAQVADFLKAVPGAETFKIRPIRKERHMIGRMAIGAGVLIAVLTVVAATKSPADQKPAFTLPGAPAGVLPLDATKIAALSDYRVATAQDFDAAAASWLRGSGVEPTGRVTGDFAGRGAGQDVVYVLRDLQGARRVVLLAGGENRYDMRYPKLGLVARVPKNLVNAIQWVGKPPRDFDGDGLLLVRQADDMASGLVLFLSGNRVVSAVPANYQTISLR